MKALTVTPGKAQSLRVDDVPEPDPRPDDLLVDGIAIGICGTDHEIVHGDYGWSPPGRDRLVIGHESLGRVREAPASSGFAEGDLVVGVVRRPDPEPCGACAHGQFDMCRNGQYTERGIKQIDGYGSERWRVEADYAVKLDPALEDVGMLLEPTSVVAKAWDQIDKVGSRSWFEPRTVLVTGAGPIGLLAGMIGVQRGLDVHLLDRVTSGPKPSIIDDLGATYHSDEIGAVAEKLSPDIIIEATGVAELVVGAMAGTAGYGIVCLTGVSSGKHAIPVKAADLNREMVLENDAVIGSVNANLGHYRAAADALAAADPAWLSRLISRRLTLDEISGDFDRRDDDVKVVVDLAGTR
ncbi:theronine dehydrogenase [Aeromicrobium sp. Root236]|uniref:glucose 1-dehydrogenase n=1 Tax=Aeromicrobium sp. Root236 TaxID=1736498 RepID=UPI0006FD5A77|nr:glucose 1-dehydrogenase [Aeromicrobium sp. Root236]KRC65324.1 theronine dehydrogenase [Aeromicrobium sp. Root236]